MEEPLGPAKSVLEEVIVGLETAVPAVVDRHHKDSFLSHSRLYIPKRLIDEIVEIRNRGAVEVPIVLGTLTVRFEIGSEKLCEVLYEGNSFFLIHASGCRGWVRRDQVERMRTMTQ